MLRMRFTIFVALVAMFAATMVDAQEAGRRGRRGQGQRGARAQGDGDAADPRALPDAWMKQFNWRSVGPANMGGRIVAYAVSHQDPCMWWAATASGGLIKTNNNGITFEHQFDDQNTVSIGHVAVAPSDDSILWVGTGEANPRNSVSWGDGVYKSTDGGKTWKNMGLKKTFQTGRIAIHPTDPNTVYVGSLGRLWGPSDERGLYKTSDGGENWERVLFLDDRTGIIDVDMHPTDPNTLIVAGYERERNGFDQNHPEKKIAPGSALYRTTDGGKNWTRLSDGLPTCDLGRIGVDYYRKDPNVVFAVVESSKIGKAPADMAFAGVTGEDADVGARVTTVTKDGPAAKAGLKEGDIVIKMGDVTIHSYNDFTVEVRRHKAGDAVKLEIARSRKSEFINMTLSQVPEPEEGGEEDQRRQFQRRRGGGARNPFSQSLGGQNPNLQDQQGADGHEHGGVYKSTDGGTTWTRINSVNPRPMYYSQIRVDPSDSNNLYVLGTSLYRSSDGGKTFTGDGARGGVHVDHHELWIDPKDGRHMLLGNDGGVYVTWDRMGHWDHHNHVAIGQFYDVGIDVNRDYYVYGGLQDNGSWGAPSRGRPGRGPVNDDWMSIGGGDGFICKTDPNDPDLVYYESQNGSMGRRNLRTGERGRIRPQAPRGTRYRWNWKTPFDLSHHNSKIFYTVGNFVFRSLDRGNDLRAISPEVTLTDKGAGSAFGESPVDPQVLYAGTTDGAFWVTTDGGAEWRAMHLEEAIETRTETINTDGAILVSVGDEDEASTKKPKYSDLSEHMPGPRWVSCIEPSRYEAGRCYVTFDGHRSNDDSPYVFVTEDHGKTWKSIRSNLPANVGSTRVIREDLENQNLLFLGTEFGAWVSVDRGKDWTRMHSNLPTVAVHDFAIHPKADEIVAGTHGRSMWILDISTLRQVSRDVVGKDAHLFKPADAVLWRSEPSRGRTLRRFVGQNPSSNASIRYSLANGAGPVSLRVIGTGGKTVRTLTASSDPGLHTVSWDLRRDPPVRNAATARGRGGRGGFRGFGGRGGARVRPGEFMIELKVGEQVFTEMMNVQIDPQHPEMEWLAFV